MKKILVLSLITVFGTLGAFAQHHKGGNDKTAEERAQHKTDKMSEKLNLTETQKTQIYEINLDAEQKMDAVRAEYKDKDSKEGMGEQMRAINKERVAKIRAILDDEQKKKFDEMVAHMQEKAKDRKEKMHHKKNDDE